MEMFGHIVSQERKCIMHETWWINIESMLTGVTPIGASDTNNT
jgi:hypothetical protein